MKERLNKFIHSRLFIIILVVTLMCTTLLIGTYAWFTWSSTDNTTLVMSIGKLADVIFESGNDINGSLVPIDDYKSNTNVLHTTFSVNNRDTSGVVINYDIKLNITTIANELISEDVKWVLEKNGVLLSEGDFSTSSNGTTITLAKDFSLLDSISYTFYLYIDGNKENNQSMIGKNITGSIIVEGVETNNATTVNLLSHITNLYSSNNPTLITQATSNDTYYYSYQDDTNTWGLMNDGLKIDTSLDATATGLATTVTSTEALTSGTEGNIRYFGPSDKVNNYIYFNCSNYSKQTDSTCEKWRIIGIVDGKVKIIRNESIGNLAWDQDKNQNSSLITYNNNWKDSSLQEFLNGLYYNRGTIESHPYYYGSDGSTTTTLNLKTIGITEATRNNNLISESTWYLGGYNSSSIYPNQIYEYERTNKKGTTIYSTNDFTIQKNIGLMYPSDYGYGTDLTKCGQNLYNYNNSADTYSCRANNWLFNSAGQWLITPPPGSFFSSNAWDVYGSGLVDQDYVYYAFNGVRPVLYLDSELNIFSVGDGSKASPYRIYVEPTKLTEHITNLYISGNPEPKPHKDTNGNTIAEYYYSYQGDKSWGLMNDGLKIDTSLDPTTTGLATTVTSTEALTSGTEGNIRYFGPSDKVNNYIYFNCSDYSNQTDSTCEKWRIIGIVDGKVKLIRDESIGNLAWDQDKNQDSSLTTYNNNWATSSLQVFLNGLYYDRGTIESHPYYSSYDGNTTTTLNLKTIGITEATRNNNLISESTWYLGGYKDSKLYPNQIYEYERTNKEGTTIYKGNPYTIDAKIGLIYASDYGYGTDLTKCSRNLSSYDNSTDTYACRANNWLFNSAYQWLITPSSSVSSSAWAVSSSGSVSSYDSVSHASRGVRPVLYLDSELTIESEGDGSSTNPYRIIAR